MDAETYQEATLESNISEDQVHKILEPLTELVKLQGGPEATESLERVRSILINAYYTLGLVGETGEIAEKMKKAIRDAGGQMPVEETAKELGDVTWYLSHLARRLGTNFGQIFQVNIDKLRDRMSRSKIQGSGDSR